MEKLYDVKLNIGELNIIYNVVEMVNRVGKYEKGDWSEDAQNAVAELINKIKIIKEDAYKKEYVLE